MRTHRVQLGILTVLLAVPVADGSSQPQTRPHDAKPTVRLIIDYNDGVQKVFTRLGWRQGMTVLDATLEAKSHPRGIRFQYRGSAATAFVTQIDDLANQGGGAGKQNWLFLVNGKLADRGCGVYALQASDVVRWQFTTYEALKSEPDEGE